MKNLKERVLFHEGTIDTGVGMIVKAMMVEGEYVTAIGSADEVVDKRGAPDRVISLDHQYVMPGFIDSHLHLMAFGFSMEYVDVSMADSIEMLQDICQRYLEEKKPPQGRWIIGRGWNQNQFKNPSFPTKEALDLITRDNPMLLLRICGHIGVVNTLGLQSVYQTEEIMPESLRFLLRQGIVVEDELEWFKTRIQPKPDRKELQQAIINASNRLLSYGVTSVHTEDSYDVGFSGSFTEIAAAYRDLESEEGLSVRIYQKISLPDIKHLKEWLKGDERTGDGSDYYRIGPVKLWLDGTLGGRTAALRQPYHDEPDNRGMLLYTDKDLEEIVFLAHDQGMQICLHAIGDAALDQAITVFEKIYQKTGQPLFHRIIHCQIGDYDLYRRMATIGVTADIQFAFIASDWPMVIPRVGKGRGRKSYAWKTLHQLGIQLAAGSDCPVEAPNPLIGIQSAVTRRDLQGQPADGFNLEEALTLQEALRIHTAGSAAAAGESAVKGSLEPGKLADFIQLSHNPFQVPRNELIKIQVKATWVGGTCRWKQSL